MKKKSFFIGYIFGLLSLAACASAYKYYGLELPPECYQAGKLLGKSPDDADWPDLPLTICQPEAGVAGKCVISKRSDYFKLDADLKKCQVALKDCQKGTPPAEANLFY